MKLKNFYNAQKKVYIHIGPFSLGILFFYTKHLIRILSSCSNTKSDYNFENGFKFVTKSSIYPCTLQGFNIAFD